VPAGSAVGLAGPNGAGKTSLMRAVCGLLVPRSGRCLVGGVDVQSDPARVHACIGYMPDFFGLYDHLYVWEYLEFFGQVYHMPEAKLRKRIDEVLGLTDLGGKRDALVGELSRGMKQRLCMGRALLHDPGVLVLDEPASGVDPRGRYEIRQMLSRLASTGKTILVSSHILPELSEVCDSLAIMESGRLVASGSLEEIGHELSGIRVMTMRILDGRAQRVPELLADMPAVAEVQVSGDSAEVRVADSDEAVADLLARLTAAGIRIGGVTERRADLEQLYLQLTEGTLAQVGP